MKIDAKRRKEFLSALESGDVGKMALLIKGGIPCDLPIDDGYILQITPLMLASGYSNYEMVELLLASGANVNARTKSESGGAGDRTPLSYAVQLSEDEQKAARVTELLLAGGADPSIANNAGYTPIDLVVSKGSSLFWVFDRRYKKDVFAFQQARSLVELASKHQDTAILRKLLEYGGEVNPSRGAAGFPLLLAAYNGAVEAIKVLLAHGASTSIVDDRGRTALHHICEFVRSASNPDANRRAVEITQLLLDNGVSMNALDDRGITALDHANLATFPEVAALLKKAGAKYGSLTKPKKGKR